MMRKPLPILAALAAFFLAIPLAQAHPGHGAGAGFYAGVAHPWSGIDHLLAMVAVGLLAVQLAGGAGSSSGRLPKRMLWLLPLTFVSLMVLGGIVGFARQTPIPGIDQAIAASVLILGLMIAVSARLPAAVLLALVGLFALFHGYAHAVEMTAGLSATTYAAGFILATVCLHAVGIALGLTAKRLGAARSVPLIRLTGAAIALCGLLLCTGLITA